MLMEDANRREKFNRCVLAPATVTLPRQHFQAFYVFIDFKRGEINFSLLK